MKDSLIREIYFGTYDPKRGQFPQSETGSAFDEILAMRERLLEDAPEAFRQRVQDFADACLSLLSEQSVEDFEEGYRLGAQLMIEALKKDIQK